MEIFRLSVEILALVLGLASIILAMKHLHGIDRQRVKLDAQATTLQGQATKLDAQAAKLDAQLDSQAAKLDSQAAKLEETQRLLSTRFIGEFPKFLPQITELISRASERITIFCDFPGYGHYSDYKDWLEYRHAIERQSENIPISLTCFTEKRRLHCHGEQFSEEERTWEEWKKGEAVRDQLKHFLQVHQKDANVDALTQDTFANLLEETDKEMLRGAFIRAVVNEIDTYIPLYFWLIDEKEGQGEAIFTIPSFSNKHLEYGFYTSVPKLTSAFAEMRDRYHREATQNS
jgi:hypothetical protein